MKFEFIITTNLLSVHLVSSIVFSIILVQLEEKMRLEIPDDWGRNVMGVLDETQTLQYGQIFVQVSEIGNPMKNIRCIRGVPFYVHVRVIVTAVTDTFLQASKLADRVIVTKNPCLQPGDVRIYEAIDVPELRHMVDVVVFPSVGDRPHPNEMAGETTSWFTDGL